MKKQIIIASLATAIIWGGTTFAVLNTASAEETKTNQDLLAVNSTLPATTQISASKNETVYVITDESGTTKSKFIGSTLYSGTEKLPFSFKATYFLDGQEISAQDLSGKTGHVKIVYSYTSTAKYQNKNIPFLAVTGIALDGNIFKNIKLESGKIISETQGNYIIAGYALAGLNENLNIDFLPNTFSIEADATNFKLSETYTVFMNEIIADLDTSKLTSLDSLVSSVYQLSDGIEKILNGATDLSNGLKSALDGVQALYTGSQELSAGAKKAVESTTLLSENLNNLNDQLSDVLNDGASEIFDSILATTSATLTAQFSQVIPEFSITLSQNNYETKLNYLKTQIPAAYADSIDEVKAKLKKVETFCHYLNFYTQSVGAMAKKTPDLVSGLSELSNGATTLSNGLGSLLEGETKLYQGSITLKDGLTTFKTSGIDKLVNFASRNLASFTANARSTINAAASYKNFGSVDAENVKFIVKTPSI